MQRGIKAKAAALGELHEELDRPSNASRPKLKSPLSPWKAACGNLSGASASVAAERSTARQPHLGMPARAPSTGHLRAETHRRARSKSGRPLARSKLARQRVLEDMAASGHKHPRLSPLPIPIAGRGEITSTHVRIDTHMRIRARIWKFATARLTIAEVRADTAALSAKQGERAIDFRLSRGMRDSRDA